ncbi:hypothetical protein [Bradyrhizobium sp. dw_411]|uniref:hypothetical protein n=1 Tax=Bradyrhizobium sp. dw_411 TaxID=2720082 RepID=UPI001BCFFF51|nr:hypothetical protein [Bradyrhizobium sp. dw_411]
MRGVRKVLGAIAMLALLLPEYAAAAELSGAWAPDADKCDKVFVRRGRAQQIDFAEFSSVHGGGFIIQADQLRGKFAKCRIKTRKEEGQSLNLIAACATDIMLSNVQFVLKVVDDDSIMRVFPGIEGMEVKYHRCRLD